jgi:Ni/Fe-hydrogenase subunit HybB-like protein
VANVYSTRLFTGHALAATTTTSAAVPTGYVWDVRDVAIYNPQHVSYGGYLALQGLYVALSTGGVIFRSPPLRTLANTSYRAELRCVMAAGTYLSVTTLEAGWDVTISGYQLTLP